MYRYFILILMYMGCIYAVDFEYLLNKAYENSYEIKQKQLDVDIATKDLDIVYAEFYPELSVGYNIENTNSLDDDNDINTNIDGNSVSNETLKKSYSYVSMNYNLYGFGRSTQKLKMQESNLDTKKYESCLYVQDIAMGLLDNYYEARTAYEKIDTFDKILDERNKIYSFYDKLYQSGEVDKISLMNASLELATTYNQKLQTKKKLDEYIKNISRIVKQDISKEHLEPISFLDNDNVKFEQTKQSLHIQSKINAKTAEIAFLDREFLPNVNFYAKYDVYGYDNDSYSKAFDNMNSNSYKWGLNVYWTLFNGFKTVSQKQKAILELKKLQYEYEAEKDKFDTRLSIIQNNTAIAQQEIVHLEQMTDLSSKTQIASTRLNEIGELGQIELIKKTVEKLYKQMEMKNMNETLAYENKKKEILNKGIKQCTVH